MADNGDSGNGDSGNGDSGYGFPAFERFTYEGEPPRFAKFFNGGYLKFFDQVIFGVPRYLRENVIRPNQQDYPYYHRRYRRVPGIEECYTTDQVCIEEADVQWRRDRAVESSIITILGGRMNDCMVHYYNQRNGGKTLPEEDPCYQVKEDYLKANMNFYIKYGDMCNTAGAADTLMKQKHRMIWERRNGTYTMSAQAKRKEEELKAEVTDKKYFFE